MERTEAQPKFTAGPWSHTGDGQILAADKKPVAFTAAYRMTVADLDGGGPATANTLLIAAAPDLFNAIFKSDDAHWTPAMRAAMKKAVGEE